jgi:hypothetical protein
MSLNTTWTVLHYRDLINHRDASDSMHCRSDSIQCPASTGSYRLAYSGRVNSVTCTLCLFAVQAPASPPLGGFLSTEMGYCSHIHIFTAPDLVCLLWWPLTVFPIKSVQQINHACLKIFQLSRLHTVESRSKHWHILKKNEFSREKPAKILLRRKVRRPKFIQDRRLKFY